MKARDASASKNDVRGVISQVVVDYKTTEHLAACLPTVTSWLGEVTMAEANETVLDLGPGEEKNSFSCPDKLPILICSLILAFSRSLLTKAQMLISAAEEIGLLYTMLLRLVMLLQSKYCSKFQI